MTQNQVVHDSTGNNGEDVVLMRCMMIDVFGKSRQLPQNQVVICLCRAG